MTVDSNPTQRGYGTIRLLELSQNAVTAGPSQVQGSFESYAPASAELTLLRRCGSLVTPRDMITIPACGGLAHIEPRCGAAAAPGATTAHLPRAIVLAYTSVS